VSIRDLIFSVQYGGNTHFQQGAKYSFRRGENTLELPGLWPGYSLCTEHDRQLGGGSPLPSLMAAKG
jgi:hypothetical protein